LEGLPGEMHLKQKNVWPGPELTMSDMQNSKMQGNVMITFQHVYS